VTPGRDGVVEDVLALWSAFPDLDLIVADMFADGDKVLPAWSRAAPTWVPCPVFRPPQGALL
jgi:hypothetical protein